MATQKLENTYAECINNEFMEELFTVGKEYKVDFKLDNNHYGVYNELGIITCLSPNYFKIYFKQ